MFGHSMLCYVSGAIEQIVEEKSPIASGQLRNVIDDVRRCPLVAAAFDEISLHTKCLAGGPGESHCAPSYGPLDCALRVLIKSYNEICIFGPTKGFSPRDEIVAGEDARILFE